MEPLEHQALFFARNPLQLPYHPSSIKPPILWDLTRIGRETCRTGNFLRVRFCDTQINSRVETKFKNFFCFYTKGCAIGSNFIAVATNKGHLRVFSTAGAQLPIISIGRPYVTMVAREGMLAVVYHMGAPFAGCQNLGYSLFNMTRRHTLVSDQTLPLTPGSRLEWIGFSQDGALSTLDSQGVLRQLISHGQRAPNLLTSLISQHPKSYNFNFQWTPVLNSAESMDQKHLMGAKFWPISVTKEKMRYVPCVRVQNDEMTSAPVVLPRPVPGTFSLEVPILGLDGPGGVHEERFVTNNTDSGVLFAFAQKTIILN
jgi:chromosome transmission fidelity protein 4